MQRLAVLCLLLCASYAACQTTTAAQTPIQAPSFNLTQVIGNLTARQSACSSYQLPSPFNNATYDTAFLGPYLSTVVTTSYGQDNYTYHQFGPLEGGTSNSTLVLIPGTDETSNVWTADLLIILAQDRQVVTFDLPGAGSTSTLSSDQQTLDYLSQSLLGFFSALNITQPDLLGYSWGGTIAMYLGAFYGDSVGNLVIVSSTSGGDGYFPGSYIQTNQSTVSTDLNALLFPNTIDGEDGLCKFDAFEAVMPGPNLTSSELRNQSIVVNSIWGNNTLSENLGNIVNPTLLVAGELDVIIDFQSTLYLLEAINSSVLLSTDTGGNGLLFQDTEQVAPVISEFLDYYDYDGASYYYDYTG